MLKTNIHILFILIIIQNANIFQALVSPKNQVSNINNNNQRKLKEQQTLSTIKEELCQLYEEKTSNSLYGEDYIGSSSSNLDKLGFLKDATADKTYLKEYLYEDQDSSKLTKNVILDIIPLIIFLVFSIFGLLSYVIVQFCFLCCPRCICCKKKKTDFYSHYEINCPLMALSTFGFWVIVTSIVGLVKGTNFLNGYYELQCQSATFFYDIDNGIEDEQYYGLQKLSEEASLITEKLQTEIENTFSENDQMETYYDNIDDISQTFNILEGDSYSTYFYTSVGNSDFDVESYFFNQVWASADTSDNRHSHNLRNMVTNFLQDLNNNVESANESGLELKNSDLFNSVTKGIAQIKDLQQEILDFSNQTYDFNSDNEQYFENIDLIVMIYFGVSLGFSVLAMVTACLIRKCKMFKLRICLHCTWVIYGLAMILGFLISITLYTVGNLGLQSCSIIDDIKEEKKLFTDIKDTGFDTDFINTLGVCIEYGTWNGNGEILNEFGLQKNLNNMKQMSSSISESLDLYYDNQDKFTDFSNYINQATSDLDTFINYGYYSASPNVYELNINSQNGISGFANGIINNDCGGSPTYDTFKDGDCAAATYDNIASDIQEVFDTTDNAANTFCGNIHLYYNQGSPYTYTLDEYSSCDSSTDLGKRLVWVKEKNTLAYSKLSDLNDFENNYNSYKTELDAWITDVESLDNQFDSTFQKIENLVDNGANCLFLGKTLFEITDTVCDVQIYDTYVLSIILICHSVGMFFGTDQQQQQIQQQTIKKEEAYKYLLNVVEELLNQTGFPQELNEKYIALKSVTLQKAENYQQNHENTILQTNSKTMKNSQFHQQQSEQKDIENYFNSKYDQFVQNPEQQNQNSFYQSSQINKANQKNPQLTKKFATLGADSIIYQDNQNFDQLEEDEYRFQIQNQNSKQQQVYSSPQFSALNEQKKSKITLTEENHQNSNFEVSPYKKNIVSNFQLQQQNNYLQSINDSINKLCNKCQQWQTSEQKEINQNSNNYNKNQYNHNPNTQSLNLNKNINTNNQPTNNYQSYQNDRYNSIINSNQNPNQQQNKNQNLQHNNYTYGEVADSIEEPINKLQQTQNNKKNQHQLKYDHVYQSQQFQSSQFNIQQKLEQLSKFFSDMVDLVFTQQLFTTEKIKTILKQSQEKEKSFEINFISQNNFDNNNIQSSQNFLKNQLQQHLSNQNKTDFNINQQIDHIRNSLKDLENFITKEELDLEKYVEGHLNNIERCQNLVEITLEKLDYKINSQTFKIHEFNKRILDLDNVENNLRSQLFGIQSKFDPDQIEAFKHQYFTDNLQQSKQQQIDQIQKKLLKMEEIYEQSVNQIQSQNEQQQQNLNLQNQFYLENYDILCKITTGLFEQCIEQYPESYQEFQSLTQQNESNIVQQKLRKEIQEVDIIFTQQNQYFQGQCFYRGTTILQNYKGNQTAIQ
ncbi:hypothetical protein PPERSA_09706 [Pseudocohnilembus persalinus]|uniref:Transmembrane protein n=1 Tax=Pseudocohnilembus persalinus TaxID=266149 RepID=A0A0V0QV56_PSEPJ|nr:hypothetical protein PPERSA_09706 [Pseudocohnilembus persalinus]|eukprot:KRX06094.1 hypothetical protein PPERSA_09706 [Pseudocohnilembus persalinus]